MGISAGIRTDVVHPRRERQHGDASDAMDSICRQLAQGSFHHSMSIESRSFTKNTLGRYVNGAKTSDCSDKSIEESMQ